MQFRSVPSPERDVLTCCPAQSFELGCPVFAQVGCDGNGMALASGRAILMHSRLMQNDINMSRATT